MKASLLGCSTFQYDLHIDVISRSCFDDLAGCVCSQTCVIHVLWTMTVSRLVSVI